MKPLSQRLLLCGVRSWCHVVQDVVFESVAPLAGGGALVADACTTQAGDRGELWNVTMVVDDVPPVVNLTGACPCVCPMKIHSHLHLHGSALVYLNLNLNVL